MITKKTLQVPAPERVSAELLRCSIPAQDWQLAARQPILRVGSMSPYRPTRREFLIGAAGLLMLAPYGCGSGGESGQDGGNTSDGTRTIEHKFGVTEVPNNPERVVTVGFNEADFALALGVVPVGIRDFIGPFSEQMRPWAQEELDGATPKLVGGEEINFEAVADLEPDLILGIYSFMDQKSYDLLAEIAPTVAQPAQYEDGGTPWQEQMRITGRALGTESRAEEVITGVEDQFAGARNRHPEFEGKTAAIALVTGGEFYLLGPEDLRTLLFTSLGFELPEETGAISRERTDLFDQDVLVFLGAGREALEADELLRSLNVAQEGRILQFGFESDFAGALGYSSPLSLPYALDIAVPKLAAALDGNPQTEVEETTG